MKENHVYSHEKNALIIMPGQLSDDAYCVCGRQSQGYPSKWWSKAISTLTKTNFNVLLNSVFLEKKEILHYAKIIGDIGFGLYACAHDIDTILIKELESRNLKSLQVPLYSVNPRTYDSICRVKGGFEKFWEFIDSLEPKKDFLVFDVCIMKKNLTEIPPTLGWVINYDLAKAIIHLPKKENKKINGIWPPKNSEIINVLDYLIQTKKEFNNNLINTEFESMKKYYLEEKSIFSINSQITVCMHGCVFDHNFSLIKKMDKPDFSKMNL